MANLRQLALFCHKMENALRSGFDVRQAFLIMQDEKNGGLSRAIQNTYDGVCQGRQLHSAMRKDEMIYTPDLVNAVYVAEQTGHFDQAFGRMAKRFDERAATQRQIRSAMIYPVIVLIVFIVSLLAVAYVWHFLPQACMSIAGIFALLAGILFFKFSSDEMSRHSLIVGNVVIRLPIVGKWIMQEEMADFASNMAVFYSCGVPVEKGLEYCVQSIRYAVLRERVRRAADWVRRGNPLSEALQNEGVFPADLINHLKTGEAAGNADEMLDRIADYYRKDVQHKTAMLMTIFRQ